MQPTCIVIQPLLKKNSLDYNYKLQEAVNLAQALEIKIGLTKIIKMRYIHAGYFFGKGHIDELKEEILNKDIDTIFINSSISAIQQRNLESILKCKVIDRNALIIAIFSKRAISKEGKLQSELAALMYQKSRLVKAWSHLERQRGGGGFIGGPGETQKELDKRLIAAKINSLKLQLQKVKLNKEIQSSGRKNKNYKTVALVGYTNAGKSALFNLLAHENVFSQNLLFATLDPTMRLVKLNKKENIILLDTVGFISDLPHQLIEAFHSTLSEIQNADLILHVIDVSNKEYKQQIQDVKTVLQEIGVTNKPYIEVYNKIDLLHLEERNVLQEQTLQDNNDAILFSTYAKHNVEVLKDKILYHLNKDKILSRIITHCEDITMLKFLYNNSSVVEQKAYGYYIYLDFYALGYMIQIIAKRQANVIH